MTGELENKIRYLSQFITDKRLRRLRKALKNRTRFIILGIDNVYHEHNASALLRTAEGLGLHEVWVIEDKNRFSPTKGVSLGVTKWLEIKRFSDKEEFLKEVRKRKYKLAATVMPTNKKAVKISEFELKEPLVLVVGSEKEGVSERLIKEADYLVTIPMLGLVESFNVSVATALFLWELRKKLEDSQLNWKLSSLEKARVLYMWLKTSIPFAKKLEQRL